ncbi:MAG TPA: DUF2752 domain-containing protein [Tepidisphaeraceae bacterium]|jgi:hypothetical protein|nr:DUF2752 domain-containing protein [Tepidisphaeraceae bacterium]
MVRVNTGWLSPGRIRRHSPPPHPGLRRAGSIAARWHWLILALALCIVAAALALRVQGDCVALWFLPGHPLPQVCVMRNWLGINCPGCGLTRSFVYMAHGRWRAAYHIHRLGWLLGAIVAGQIPYRLLCIYYKPVVTRTECIWVFGVLVFLMVANWVLELCRVLPPGS